MRLTYLKEKPKCKYCGKEMFLDDVDYNFKGNQDEYWMCESEDCDFVRENEYQYSLVAKIRFCKLWKID